MRLFSKIFISVITVFSVIFLASGYFILNDSLESSIQRELQFALKQYKYDKFTVQSELLANEDKLLEKDEETFQQLTEEITEPFCLFFGEETLYKMKMDAKLVEVGALEGDSYWYQIVQKEKESFILIGSKIIQEGRRYDDNLFAFVTKSDITETVEQQKNLQEYFKRCYCIALLVSVFLIFGLSMVLTNPMKQMTTVANRIAKGSYGERLQVKSHDEMGELADSFNKMASAVEEQIVELADKAKQKEDFVANFAHELKTPLTSIIGYADMIYQKDLSREEVKQSAWYIWNEGMRLEALSLKLMDLTNLNRQEIPLVEVSAQELLEDIVEGMKLMLESKRIELDKKIDDAYIRADYDLMKTLLLNVIDNAIKADCTKISLEGIQKEDQYCIEVSDNGRGIPKNELSRITEAFYMVDKSRSRKQHSAGIGLSLVEKIVDIHKGTMTIQSKEEVGTKVLISIPCEKGSNSDE
jgi:signal transduction histidine kinase